MKKQKKDRKRTKPIVRWNIPPRWRWGIKAVGGRASQEAFIEVLKTNGEIPDRRREILCAGLLAAIALGLYLPMLRAGFVWDARQVVLGFDYVHGFRNIADILTLRVMHLDVIDNNRPVFLLSAMLDWTLWGSNPFGYHLTNILLHALVTVLLFVFMRRLMPGTALWIPFASALLFAVHPVNCEAVAEVSYRKDLIAAAGVLAALNLAAVFQPRLSRKNLLTGCACVVCLFLAVGAKENGVAGPAVLIGYWLLFRRHEPRAGWIALCASSSFVVAAFLVARFTLPPEHSIIFTVKPAPLAESFAETLQIQTRIWAFYLRQIVLPMDLCADYNGYSIRNFDFGISLAAVLAVAGFQIFLSAKNRIVCLGAALFWLSLLPVSNLIPIYRPVADRFLYLPLCGAALMLAALGSVAGFGRPIRFRRKDEADGTAQLPVRAAAAAMLIAAGCLGSVTFRRERVWQNEGALWRDTAKTNPFSFTAAANLAEALVDEGKLEEAVASDKRAIGISGAKCADPFSNMAVALEQLGRHADADAAYKKAMELDARYRTPDALVKALVCLPEQAHRFDPLARRNAGSGK